MRASRIMHFWRPVGLKELELVFDSDMTGFPPRLPEQPIFYPVLNEAYAIQIAREWNTLEGDAAGYVTRFEVPDAILNRYPRQVVGSSMHEELWIPAKDLTEFNRMIRGPITVQAAFFGPAFTGMPGIATHLKGKLAKDQFRELALLLAQGSIDTGTEIDANRKVIFLHLPFWEGLAATDLGVDSHEKAAVLAFIENRWRQSDIPFPLPRR